MIAIKARITRQFAQAQQLGDESGVLLPSNLARPFEAIPTKPFVEDEIQIVYVNDDAVAADDPRRCVPSDFPPRPEDGVLVEGYPPVVPSGQRSSKIDATGKLVQSDPSQEQMGEVEVVK